MSREQSSRASGSVTPTLSPSRGKNIFSDCIGNDEFGLSEKNLAENKNLASHENDLDFIDESINEPRSRSLLQRCDAIVSREHDLSCSRASDSGTPTLAPSKAKGKNNFSNCVMDLDNRLVVSNLENKNLDNKKIEDKNNFSYEIENSENKFSIISKSNLEDKNIFDCEIKNSDDNFQIIVKSDSRVSSSVLNLDKKNVSDFDEVSCDELMKERKVNFINTAINSDDKSASVIPNQFLVSSSISSVDSSDSLSSLPLSNSPSRAENALKETGGLVFYRTFVIGFPNMIHGDKGDI